MRDPDGASSARRHWPRDAPIRWGRFVRGLAFHGVASVAAAANLALGGLVIVAIAGDLVDGLEEWVLALAWGAGAIGQFYAWWLHRRLVALPPIAVGALLWLLASA
jgi:hypothetical protein